MHSPLNQDNFLQDGLLVWGRSWWQGTSLTIVIWRYVAAQSCDKDLWRCIMAAVGAQAGSLAGSSDENLSQVFQVLVRMHAHPPAQPVT